MKTSPVLIKSKETEEHLVITQNFQFDALDNRKEQAADSDAYRSGYCGRCNRKRVDCQRIIDSGVRCTEKAPVKKEGK